MKRLVKRLEDIMVAVTFAEAGEYDEASRHSGSAANEENKELIPGLKKSAVGNTSN